MIKEFFALQFIFTAFLFQIPTFTENIYERVLGLGLGAIMAFVFANWKRIDDKNYQETLQSIIKVQGERENKQAEREDKIIALVGELKNLIGEIGQNEKLERKMEARFAELQKSISNAAAPKKPRST